MVNVSQLHERLSHLVNYSSQLIFVSGDSIADQQKTLNAFLSSQQETTEISFFTATRDKLASDYRGEICRQLAGHEVGSFIRPLTELLNKPTQGVLNPSSAYLVCITQAQNLDTTFLQELWDWVMQGQKTHPDIHLNIILFGESQWAKASQEWLPMQNSHKPVLLSSELVNPVGFDVNALEALIADKSSWFGVSQQPLVTNKWFIGGILSIFLVVFIGLMALQYPTQFSNTIALLYQNNEEPNSAAYVNSSDSMLSPTDPENEAPLVLNENRAVIVDDQLFKTMKTDSFEPLTLASANIELTGSLSLEASQTAPLDLIIPAKKQSLTDTLLVKNWPESVAMANKKVKNIANKVRQEDTSPIAQISALAKDTKAIETSASEDGDFQVPDILSVEQLDAQFVNIDTKKTNRIDNNGLAKKIPSTVTQSKQVSMRSGATLGYQFDETTLLAMPAVSIVLQLSGIQNPAVLESYLSNNNLKTSTWVYETKRYGGPWYVVLYKESFGSVDAALSQLASLPEDVKKAQPFAKSINQIQREISRREL